MATRQEIIDIIDAFLENRMTFKEAVEWAQKELGRTPDCEDPASALITFVGSDNPEEFTGRPMKEQLLMDKEVLVHGVPCPDEELGKTVEAFCLAFTPWEKIVLCQVRITENGERVLHVTEEAWDGTQLFYEEIPIPLKEGNGPPLTWNEIDRKRDKYWSGKIKQEEFLNWILDQLRRENALREYDDLLLAYWRARRKDDSALEYIKGSNKLGLGPLFE